ncbi:MAG TPA: hypothetical protein VF381_13130, partial [Thermoanaerobaculia bacterium]
QQNQKPKLIKEKKQSQRQHAQRSLTSHSISAGGKAKRGCHRSERVLVHRPDRGGRRTSTAPAGTVSVTIPDPGGSALRACHRLPLCRAFSARTVIFHIRDVLNYL